MSATAKPYIGMNMEGFIARWYAKNTGKDRATFAGDAVEAAKDLSAGATILDLAAGPGYWAIGLAQSELARQRDFHVVGLDISHTFVELGEQAAREAGVSVDFRQGDASKMPFADETFDLISCRAAFKNFSRPLDAINEMYRVLKPGGRAIINDLRKDATDAGIEKELDFLQAKGINRFVTRFTFKHSLLKRAHTRDELETLARQSRFGGCEIREKGISIDVVMVK